MTDRTHSLFLGAILNVDDVVQERIAEARRRIERKKRRRAELAEARRYGLRVRHATKVHRLKGTGT